MNSPQNFVATRHALLDSLEFSLTSLRDRWPARWPGLKMVFDRCLDQLGAGPQRSLRMKSLVSAAHAIAQAIEDDGVARMGLGRVGVDVGNRAARAWFGGLKLRSLTACIVLRVDRERANAVFVMRQQASCWPRGTAQHHVGAKAAHVNRCLALAKQACVELIQRRGARHEHRKAIAELVARRQALRPIGTAGPMVRLVKAHQTQRPKAVA